MKFYQEYECEECGLKSKVEFKEHATVYEVVMSVDDDHKQKAKECENPVNNLKLNGIKRATVAKAKEANRG